MSYDRYLYSINTGVRFSIKHFIVDLGFKIGYYSNHCNNIQINRIDNSIIGFYAINPDSSFTINENQKFNYNPRINDLFFLKLGLAYKISKHFEISGNISYNPFHTSIYQTISITGNTFKEGYNDPNKIYNLNQIEHNSGLLLLNFGLTYTIFKPKYKYKTKKELAVESK